MDWFLSRYMALFRLQILCSFGWKWDDYVDWGRGNIGKEGTDQFHSPTKTRTCILQNIIPLGSDRLLSQMMNALYFVLCSQNAREIT